MATLEIRIALVAAGLHGAVAVALAAYAAHGMAGGYSAQAIDYVTLGSRFQLVHAAALIGAGVLVGRLGGRAARIAAGLSVAGFALGPLLFSGALYSLAFAGAGGFGRFAPIGGTVMIVAWLCLAMAGLLSRKAVQEPR